MSKCCPVCKAKPRAPYLCLACQETGWRLIYILISLFDLPMNRTSFWDIPGTI
jgi:hypothetical protein